jgi:hypothetical protein
MSNRQDGPERRTDAKHPAEYENVRCELNSPGRCGEDQQNDQACPFEAVPRPGVDVRLAVAIRTTPSLVET